MYLSEHGWRLTGRNIQYTIWMFQNPVNPQNQLNSGGDKNEYTRYGTKL